MSISIHRCVTHSLPHLMQIGLGFQWEDELIVKRGTDRIVERKVQFQSAG